MVKVWSFGRIVLAVIKSQDFGIRVGIYWGYIGIMEKKMDTTCLYLVYNGIL